jgi:hypothetical protein
MLQVQQISSNKQNNSKNYFLLAGFGGSLALGSLHGVAKEFDIDNTCVSDIEYRNKLKLLKTSGRTDEYNELLHAPKRVAVKMKGLKKILNPVDQWILNGISKLPKGKDFANYLTKSKVTPKSLFGRIVYDTPLMAKGALFTGLIYLTTVGIIKAISKIRKKSN